MIPNDKVRANKTAQKRRYRERRRLRIAAREAAETRLIERMNGAQLAHNYRVVSEDPSLTEEQRQRARERFEVVKEFFGKYPVADTRSRQ
jgi:hypothetical protein